MPARLSPAPAADVAPRRVTVAALGVALALLVVLLAVASLAVGSRPVPPEAALRALWAPDSSPDALVVHQLRVPRTVLGVLVGAALGCAGAVIQALTRNPLAEPGLLGVNAGAASAVVVVISVLGVSNPAGLAAAALAGAALATGAVLLIGASRGVAADPVRLVLAGVALAACLHSVTGAITLIDARTFDSYRFWVVGSLEDRQLTTALVVAPLVVAGGALAWTLGRGLDALALGQDVGRSLGLRTTRLRLLALLAVTLLCGGATAAAGPVSFVGLVVPHAIRLVVGPGLRRTLPLCALGGAALVLASDIIGRVVARPSELEVGIVTAFVGAPLLLWLALRGSRR
ncbi:iron complex transport system permease protein [Quadrisphaera granulorum]|uniref:Iron complex transport system permease protein n=1 Tax=Quadrisphaera granulorum TaxID=317664 RepID=A0A315ZUC9_9ACTN|nr:iron chelate uptake ABC transporter family permease subunit [Quadrisphaera granulorum]PWJ48458.1 iron complex transport system permease protein [Quadrisphaera granulorum]SZE98417.1 iron complex transport system permease protein [Quadrisphaera granulorum]